MARGEEALAAFTKFFLTVCIDQVTFMQGLVEPDRLRARILMWAEEETRLGTLPAKAGRILPSARRGELCPRSWKRAYWLPTAPEGSSASCFWLAARWMPGLFPEQSE